MIRSFAKQMKFSAAVSVLAASFASAKGETMLRSAAKFLGVTSDSAVYDARMIVSGIPKDLTALEADRMAKEAMAAYNEVFSKEKLNAAKATASTMMDDGKTVFTNAQFILEESAIFGFDSEADTLNLHKEFEEHFCEHLQETGLPVFSQAKDCSFSFLAKPGMTSQVPIESTYTSSHGSPAQAELILAGLKDGAMTKADQELLEKVVVESHNEAFAKWGLALASFDVITDVHVGGFQGWLGQCSPCCNDDEPLCPDDATQNTVTVVAANTMPVLAASGVEGFRKVDAEIANNAMDTLVCTKLRNSGRASFAGVHTCSYQFVYTEVGGASPMLME